MSGGVSTAATATATARGTTIGSSATTATKMSSSKSFRMAPIQSRMNYGSNNVPEQRHKAYSARDVMMGGRATKQNNDHHNIGQFRLLSELSSLHCDPFRVLHINSILGHSNYI